MSPAVCSVKEYAMSDFEVFSGFSKETVQFFNLTRALKKISRAKGFELGGKHYKRIPPGFDPGHPHAEFLLYNGFYFGQTIDIPAELYSAKLVDFCFARFKALVLLHKWLVGIGIGYF